ncbi:hypothetical protein B0H14DRAFT_3596077 [Mycena olivaceomarginata]|nr:hypothetical protein B0H14DRAFT_3596077 [Mycena olivaceomarginata]
MSVSYLQRIGKTSSGRGPWRKPAVQKVNRWVGQHGESAGVSISGKASTEVGGALDIEGKYEAKWRTELGGMNEIMGATCTRRHLFSPIAAMRNARRGAHAPKSSAQLDPNPYGVAGIRRTHGVERKRAELGENDTRRDSLAQRSAVVRLTAPHSLPPAAEYKPNEFPQHALRHRQPCADDTHVLSVKVVQCHHPQDTDPLVAPPAPPGARAVGACACTAVFDFDVMLVRHVRRDLAENRCDLDRRKGADEDAASAQDVLVERRWRGPRMRRRYGRWSVGCAGSCRQAAA